MARKCEKCGKGIMYGNNVSHSKRRTKRIFKPNLQYVRLMVGGKYTRMRLCASCIKLIRKSQKTQASKEKAVPQTYNHSKNLQTS